MGKKYSERKGGGVIPAEGTVSWNGGRTQSCQNSLSHEIETGHNPFRRGVIPAKVSVSWNRDRTKEEAVSFNGTIY